MSRACVLASALIAALTACTDDTAPPKIACTDPLGGELHGTVGTTVLGPVAKSPTVTRFKGSTDMGSGMTLQMVTAEAYVTIHMTYFGGPGPAAVDPIAPGPGAMGTGESPEQHLCVDQDPKVMTGTVLITLADGTKVTGWYNALYTGPSQP